MKDHTKYLFLAALALAGGCSKSDTDSSKTNRIEVTFTTAVETRVQRKDVITVLSSGDAMSLYRSSESLLSEKCDVCQATCTDGVWRGTPAVTLAPGQKAYLFAAYPYRAEAGDPLAYPVSVAAQTDYLYSGFGVDVSYATPTARLNMKHALCILAFNIRSYVGGELRGIDIEDGRFPLEGTMAVSSGSIDVTRRGNYTYSCTETLTEQGWTTGHPGFFAIPHSVSAGQTAVVLRIGDDSYRLTLPATRFAAGKKYVHQVVVTGLGATLLPEETEILTLDADTGALSPDPYGTLRVTHTNRKYFVPGFYGASPYGFVYWGDGDSNAYYETAVHDYSGSGPYTVVYEMWRAEKVGFSGLAGIEEIDLSQF